MMEQISNKALTLLLLIAIIVSVIGTIVSINRLNQLIPKITGLGTSATGMVNVTIAAVTSILATDTQITFGSCSPTASVGCNATSNISNTNFNCSCTGGSAPDNITIKNDGNKNVNVSVQTNALPSTFIGGTDPWGPEMYFSTRNSSDIPGCFNVTNSTIQPFAIPLDFDGTTGMQWIWKNMSVVNTNYLACANLTPAKSFYLFAKLFIPADAPIKTGANATLTFTATSW